KGSSTGAVALGAEEHQVVLVARVVQVEPVDAQAGVEAIALQALGRYVAEIVGIQQASHAEPAVEQHGAGSQHRVAGLAVQANLEGFAVTRQGEGAEEALAAVELGGGCG